MQLNAVIINNIISMFSRDVGTIVFDKILSSMLYSNTVTSKDIAKYGVNEKNPLAALATCVDYGRQIVIKISLDKNSNNV